MKTYTLRKFNTNRDLSNIPLKSFSHGLELLNKRKEDIEVEVEWLGIMDVGFRGTRDYIRIINRK